MSQLECVLEVDDLTHRYGSFVALDNVRLRVPKDSIYGLLGLNGAGKTTALQCALGLLPHQSGQIRVLDVPASQIYRTWGRVSVVFDSANVYGHLTVRQNLDLAWRWIGKSGRTPKEALEWVGLERFSRRRAKKLSLGMAKRLSIARGLLGSPEFVIMDEPLAGLDAEGVDSVLSTIVRCHRELGVTFMLSSHRLYELETLCTHIGLIHQGKVVSEGPMKDILESGIKRIKLQATPSDSLEPFLRSTSWVKSFHPIEDSRERRVDEAAQERLDTWIVELESGDSATLNKSLVDGGLNVHQLTPIGSSLPDFFRDATGIKNS